MDGLTLFVPSVSAAVLLAAGHAARGGQRPPPVRGVLTGVRLHRAAELARALRACRGRGPREWRAGTLVVDRRIGRWRTLAFRTADGRFLASCDSIGAPIEGRRWCGATTGTLYGGRLRDPRLTLCDPRRGRPVAFLWVVPRPRARWVAIEERRRIELYRVAGGLPVRVASDRLVRIRGSTATFLVRQYDGRGRLLLRRTVVATVAG
jgi:hypothetical protein